VLKPKTLVDKSEAWEGLMAVLQGVHKQNKGVDLKKVERDVIAAIQRLRQREWRPASFVYDF